jgi:hypothetical protein
MRTKWSIAMAAVVVAVVTLLGSGSAQQSGGKQLTINYNGNSPGKELSVLARGVAANTYNRCTEDDIIMKKICKRIGFPHDGKQEILGELTLAPVLIILSDETNPGKTCVCYGATCYCN